VAAEQVHVFVGDLAPEVTDRDMLNFFQSRCGSVMCVLSVSTDWRSDAGPVPVCSDARVMWDHIAGKSRGYGFVTFRSRSDAEIAITTINGVCLTRSGVCVCVLRC
jgi:nucleolysin TIA-1/TIAR